MINWFPTLFQWFILISTVCLAGVICRSLVLSFIKPPHTSNAESDMPVESAKSGAADNVGKSAKSGAAANAGKSVKASAAADIGADAETPAIISEHYNKPPFYTIRQPVFWHIVILAALSRVILYGVAFLASRIYIDSGGSFLGALPNLWQRSDAPHYVAIAENWYVNTGEDRVFLVFLPFFPILIRLFSYVFGNAVFSGILISLLSYIAACVLFYEVALLIGQDEGTAYHSVKYAVFFPASFFINGAFSEGLFLLTSALFFHCLLRKKWLLAACFGLLASFTRYYGLLLVIPFAIELAQDFASLRARALVSLGKKEGAGPIRENAAILDQPGKREGAAPSRNNTAIFKLADVIKRSVPILLIPAGTGIYLVINYAVSGNFFQFLIYQREHWNQRFAFFFDNVRTLAQNVIAFDRATSASLFIPQIICIVLFIALLAYGAITKFRVSFLAYLGVYYLLSISAYWMLSFPRYIFGAVPIFHLMASLGNRSHAADALISMACFAGLIFLTIAYTCGFHVY